jgi:large subunit ribosomal protein L10
MNKAREGKVAVVDGVKNRAEGTSTAVVTEYRGLTVAEISALRKELRQAGAEYKVLKNSLVRRAVEGTQIESLTEFLTGPTAIAWVKGDISAVAKVLRNFAKEAPSLVVKGGVLDGKTLSFKDLTSLADLPSRDVLLSQLAGLFAAPMRQMANLLNVIPQNFAYGLAALVESRGGVPAVAAPDAADEPTASEESAPVAEESAPIEDTAPETVASEAASAAPEADPTAAPEAGSTDSDASAEADSDQNE